MREFILLALKAKTSDNFSLDNLVKAGRMDLVCRFVSNTLFIANDLRRDTIVHVCMNGANDPPKIISFYGETLRGIEPDEKSIAIAIKLVLKEKLKLNEEKLFPNGIKIQKKAFESLVKEKFNNQLIYLHPKGEDIRNFKFSDNVVFVLGDHIGLPKKTENLLDRLNAKKINLGPKMLFASHCSIIVHNELDRK